MHSLSRRLLLSVSLPLALFFGVMMYVLDSGFRALSERSLRELLDAQMVSLIAARRPAAGRRLRTRRRRRSTRAWSMPHSGLYAQIRSDAASAGARPRPRASPRISDRCSRSGDRTFGYGTFGHERVALESRAIRFAGHPGDAATYTFSVAVGLSPYEEQLWHFRRQLLGWFIGLMLVLLVTLAALLHWVLGPVRRMEREINEVEEGASEKLGGGYPRELAGVAGEPERAARWVSGGASHAIATRSGTWRTA